MDNIHLHLGFVQRVLFALLKLARQIQDLIAETYWKLFCVPLLFLAWKINGAKSREDGSRHIYCHKDKKVSFVFGFLIRWMLIFNQFLNGLRTKYSAYELLLTWNPKVPLIALQARKHAYTIHILDAEDPDNKGIYPVIDLVSISTSTVSGYFAIIEKRLDGENPSRVQIDCVWLTGDTKGQKFSINWLGNLTNPKRQTSPDSIYFPPYFIVWFFEMIISISAVITLVGLCISGYKYLSPYISEKISSNIEAFNRLIN